MSANTVIASATPEALTAAVKPPRLEASVASELNALWRSVFDRVHAAERQHDSGSEPSHSGIGGRGAAGAQAFAPDLKPNESAGVADLRVDAARRPHPNPPPQGGRGQGGGAAPSAASDVEPHACTSGSPIVSVAIAQALSSDTEAAPPSTERARPTGAAHRLEATSADASEAVNVFVQQGLVAIAVRNATLPDDEALRCAFETACTLAGERAALRELTLNGRTVYRQSPPPHSATSRTLVPTLVFAC